MSGPPFLARGASNSRAEKSNSGPSSHVTVSSVRIESERPVSQPECIEITEEGEDFAERPVSQPACQSAGLSVSRPGTNYSKGGGAAAAAATAATAAAARELCRQ